MHVAELFDGGLERRSGPVMTMIAQLTSTTVATSRNINVNQVGPKRPGDGLASRSSVKQLPSASRR